MSWADNDDPNEAETRLLDTSADRHEVGMMPIANRQDADIVRQEHGITGSTIPQPRPDSLDRMDFRDPIAGLRNAGPASTRTVDRGGDSRWAW